MRHTMCVIVIVIIGQDALNSSFLTFELYKPLPFDSVVSPLVWIIMMEKTTTWSSFGVATFLLFIMLGAFLSTWNLIM